MWLTFIFSVLLLLQQQRFVSSNQHVYLPGNVSNLIQFLYLLPAHLCSTSSVSERADETGQDPTCSFDRREINVSLPLLSLLPQATLASVRLLRKESIFRSQTHTQWCGRGQSPYQRPHVKLLVTLIFPLLNFIVQKVYP